jgi:NAD(P)H-flavin reductase
VRVFRLGKPVGFTFRPGQYLRLGTGGGRRAKFSIASAPHDPDLEVAVEMRPGGRVTPALFGLAVGDRVEVDPSASGRFDLDESARHHLMIATVTGIAPLRSMLRAALHGGSAARFTVLLGASYAIELPFHDELRTLAGGSSQVTYVPTISRPGAPGDRPWNGSVGRVDAVAREVARSLDPGTTCVYAVGHAGMVAAVRADLAAAGFRIRTESYGG